MAECWICLHRLEAPQPAVGCCIHCHIHACDVDGDRLQKQEFWCHICLGNALVDSSGLVTSAGDAIAGPQEAMVSLGDVPPWATTKLEGEMATALDWVRGQRSYLRTFGGPTVDVEMLALGVALLAHALGGMSVLFGLGRSTDQRRSLIPEALSRLLDEQEPA